MKTTKYLLSATFILTVAFKPIVVAFSTPPEPIVGTFTETDEVVHWVRTANGDALIGQTVTFTSTGSWSGVEVAEAIVIVPPNGKANLRAKMTFTGEVDGNAGTLQIQMTSKIDLSTFAINGRWVILSGTGELANLRGQGTFTGLNAPGVPGTGTLSGQIHADP